MEKTKECYGIANTLDDAKLCDVIANEGAKIAQEKMESGWCARENEKNHSP